MKRWQLFFLCLPALVVFYSCQTGSGKLKPPVDKDTVGRIALVTHPIPPAQLKYYHENIDAFYQKYLVRSGFNGGILVAKDGQVVFEKYRGYFDLRKKDSLTPHSAFHLASVSKTFTAMAVLRLVMEHSISLDDSVQKFFPAFPYHGVTVKTLLNHRSGLPNYLYFMDKLGWPSKVPCTNEDILDYMIRFKPPVSSQPDRHFQYCNTNFSLLALIIEKVSGMKYEDYLKKEFFIPLGMNDTYVYNLKRDSATAMPSFDYRGRPEAFTFLDEGVGDKNIYSTPEDMLKWDQALYTNVFFSDDIISQAYTPYSNERPGIRNYGLGWRMNIYPDGHKIIYHNGWWHGNNTVFIRDIENGVTIIVLGNKFNKNIYQAKKIAEIFEGGRAIEDE